MGWHTPTTDVPRLLSAANASDYHFEPSYRNGDAYEQAEEKSGARGAAELESEVGEQQGCRAAH